MVRQLAPFTQYEIDDKYLEPHELSKSGTPVEEIPFRAMVTKTGLVLPENLDASQWKELGLVLAKTDTAIQWAIGDWWAYGYQLYGKKARKIAKELPYEVGSLINLGSVARKVKPSLRNEDLSFSHHVVVAKLEPDKQAKWLKRAATYGFSVSKLRRLVDEHESPMADIQPTKQARDWYNGFIDQVGKFHDRNFMSDLSWLNALSLEEAEHVAETAAVGARRWEELAVLAQRYVKNRGAAETKPIRRVRLHSSEPRAPDSR